MITNLNLWCIHGNLQNPNVWDFLDNYNHELIGRISGIRYRINIIKINLWNDIACSMKEWALKFCNQVENLKPKSKNILLGYSLGGRLAMQSLIRKSELWSAAIIVSAHPGLKSEEERSNSINFDMKWINKFQNENWKDLINEWDSLPVFHGLDRLTNIMEEQFNRDAIGKLFRSYSKGYQDYFPDKLKKISNLKMLYIAGAADKKYFKIGDELAELNENITFYGVEHAGHRVPWENQSDFSVKIFDFIVEHI